MCGVQSDSEEDEEAVRARKKVRARQERGKQWQEGDSEDEAAAAAEAERDRQREADQLEKEEFEERLKARDDASTKKVRCNATNVAWFPVAHYPPLCIIPIPTPVNSNPSLYLGP